MMILSSMNLAVMLPRLLMQICHGWMILVPGHLLCHVHPACMFTRKVQEMCNEIDLTIGPENIFSSFAVSSSEVQVLVVEQWMDFLTRLVAHDFDHLLEPYLSLTTSSNTDYDKLREAFPTLYNDLISTPPAKLLDFTTPAFSFVSKGSFEHYKYDSKLLEPTLDMIKAFQPEILNLLEILLPKLAAGWELQRPYV